MVRTKKLFAVVMALVMLASCFVVSASALTYAPTNTTGEVKLVASADKTTVLPGDVVTITMSIDPGSLTDLSSFAFQIIYNGGQLTPVGSTAAEFRTWLGDCANFANPNASFNLNYNVTGALGAGFTADEKAYYTKGINVMGTTLGGATARWNPAAGGEAFVSFQMTVSDSVQAGDEIWVGSHNVAFTRNQGYFTQNNKRLTVAQYDLTNSMVKLTVGSAEVPATPLTVSYWKDQIRFDKNPDGSYFGTFDYRILATIDNFDDVYASIDENTISDIGFIFNKGTAINLDAAKAQVEGGAKTYSQVKNVYVSTAYDGENYVISCLVNNIPDADKGTDLSAMAYIIYEQGGETKYAYSAVQTSTFEDLYDVYYSQAFGA